MKNLMRIILILVCLMLVTACYQIVPFPIPGIEIDENQDAENNPEPGTTTVVETIKIINGTATISVNTSPAGENDSTPNSTIVSIPESVVSDASKVKLTITPYNIEKANYIITDSDCIVGAINISMELDSIEVSEFSSPVTITTYVAKGLEKVNVKYNGSGVAPSLESYDKETGKVVFTTTHFSIFYIVSDSVVAYIQSTNTAYATLSEAIKNAPSESLIKVLQDTTGEGLSSSDGNQSRKSSLIIDFAGYTYTMKDPAVGSTGTETQAMHWGTSLGAVTLKNGTFKIAEDTKNVLMAMQNYINFTAENMYFDFSNIPVKNYGEHEFTGNNEKYNGREVPMFNNNKGEMYLNGCTVIMPAASTKGISVGGDFVKLENTKIDGYINFQDNISKLIVTGSSQFDGVVPYFDGGKIISSTSDEGTIYQLTTE